MWDDACQAAFVKFKEILMSDLLLTHYNPRLPIVEAANASQTGIGGIAYHCYPDKSMKAFVGRDTRFKVIIWKMNKFDSKDDRHG